MGSTLERATVQGMYIDPTVPFVNKEELSIHFWKHGKACGAATEVEYESMASSFMEGQPNLTSFQCIRKSGTRDRVRLDDLTGNFGVAYGVCTLRTFFTRTRAQINNKGGARALVDAECLRSRL